jgi:hypothetical protein
MTAEQTAPFYLAAYAVTLAAVIIFEAIRQPRAGRLKPWVDSGK